MAHSIKISAVLISVLAAMAGSAYAQLQPPAVNPVVSDNFGNTAMGTRALITNGPPSINPTNGVGFSAFNTASGFGALYSNTTGSWNSATGYQALYSNTTGVTNTAVGFEALYSNTVGTENTAVGHLALTGNTTGVNNTAIGYWALSGNTTGSFNSACGYLALSGNTTGGGNTATGYQALFSPFGTTAALNTATGFYALRNITEGSFNTATGSLALLENSTGGYNTAYGLEALYLNTTGDNNTALGYQAGANLLTGSNNIDIGNPGGSSAESGMIRIGSLGVHTATYIAGITDSHIRGRNVVISEDGRLGVEGSSERYKTDITTMGSSTANLQQLRPVTFRLKDDPHGPVQYGLIAEEVAKVYPELVIRDGEGKIDGVRYEALAPMLLNEVQQQQKEIVDQKASIAVLTQQLRDVQQQLAEVKELNQAKTSQAKSQSTEERANRL